MQEVEWMKRRRRRKRVTQRGKEESETEDSETARGCRRWKRNGSSVPGQSPSASHAHGWPAKPAKASQLATNQCRSAHYVPSPLLWFPRRCDGRLGWPARRPPLRAPASTIKQIVRSIIEMLHAESGPLYSQWRISA